MIHIRIADKWYDIIEFDDYATIEAEAEGTWHVKV